MKKISHKPTHLVRIKERRNGLVLILLASIALIGVAECGRFFMGWSGAELRLLEIIALTTLAYGLFRIIFRFALYPGISIPARQQRGYAHWNRDREGMTAIRLHLDDKTVVDARLLEPVGAASPSGTVILFCLGNCMLYEQFLPENFSSYIQHGHSVCLYNPPQYGRSTGVRTPASDFWAIEGVIDYLTRKAGFSAEKIRLEGLSLGSGPACWAASRYPVERLTLHVPIGKMEDVVERAICNAVSWPIGRWVAAWLTTPLVKSCFNYDNVARIAESRAAELVIYDRDRDFLMTVGGVAEADKLYSAWQGQRNAVRRQSSGHHIHGCRTLLTLSSLGSLQSVDAANRSAPLDQLEGKGKANKSPESIQKGKDQQIGNAPAPGNG